MQVEDIVLFLAFDNSIRINYCYAKKMIQDCSITKEILFEKFKNANIELINIVKTNVLYKTHYYFNPKHIVNIIDSKNDFRIAYRDYTGLHGETVYHYTMTFRKFMNRYGHLLPLRSSI